MVRTALLLALAAAALAGCNSYAPPRGQMGATAAAPRMSLASDQCFRTRDIRNHTIADDHTLYLAVNGSGVYRVTMTGACLAGAFASDPLVTRQPPGSEIVCRPLDLDLSISRSGGPATPCLIQSIAKLTPQEAAALPDKVKP